MRLEYYFDLLYELVRRDLKLRYKRSVLGMAWSLLNPLFQLLILSFIFSIVLPLNIPNYPSFLFTGLLAWNWFQIALYSATGAIVDNRELVRRPGFPVTILPVVTVTSQFIHFLLASPILLVFLVLSGIHLTAAIFFLPVIWTVQFMITLSLAYMVAALHVTFRDTQHLLGIALMLGFYLTPIFYDANALPSQYRWVYGLNPVAILIDAYRELLIGGRLPGGIGLLALSVLSSLLLAIGYIMFRKASLNFAEEL